MAFNSNLPPNDRSGQLSQRAAEMLRELQGMRIPDDRIPELSELAYPDGATHRVDPLFADPDFKFETTPAPKAKSKTSFFGLGKKAFSRDAYLKEVRSNMVGHMLISTVSLGLLVIASLAAIDIYFSPTLEEMKDQAEVIERIPGEIVSVNNQIKDQKQRRETLSAQQANLIDAFPTNVEAYASYADFLAYLENQKVWVVNQKTSVSQIDANPLLATALAAEGAATNVKPAAGQPRANNAKAKAMIQSGDIKPGLNYYHLEFALEGGYVGYLAARQKLINQIPNLIVHQESVQASTKSAGLMDIKVFMSIPFIHTP